MKPVIIESPYAGQDVAVPCQWCGGLPGGNVWCWECAADSEVVDSDLGADAEARMPSAKASTLEDLS